MSITPYLDELDTDPETKRVLAVALAKTRVSLGLTDNLADGIIAKQIVELGHARSQAAVGLRAKPNSQNAPG
jgi:hypothetical protein